MLKIIAGVLIALFLFIAIVAPPPAGDPAPDTASIYRESFVDGVITDIAFSTIEWETTNYLVFKVAVGRWPGGESVKMYGFAGEWR